MPRTFAPPEPIEPLKTPRKYLGVFLLAQMKAEHAQLKDVIAHWSGHDYKIAFTQAFRDQSAVVGYLFTSTTRPYDMGFAQVLLNGDNYLIVEIGDMYSEVGLNVAAAWLRARQGK